MKTGAASQGTTHEIPVKIATGYCGGNKKDWAGRVIYRTYQLHPKIAPILNDLVRLESDGAKHGGISSREEWAGCLEDLRAHCDEFEEGRYPGIRETILLNSFGWGGKPIILPREYRNATRPEKDEAAQFLPHSSTVGGIMEGRTVAVAP